MQLIPHTLCSYSHFNDSTSQESETYYSGITSNDLGPERSCFLSQSRSTCHSTTRFDGNARSRDPFLRDIGNTKDSLPTRTTVPQGLISSSQFQIWRASKPAADTRTRPRTHLWIPLQTRTMILWRISASAE